MADVLDPTQLPLVAAVAVSILVIMVDRSGPRHVLFLAFILFSAWIQSTSLGWQSGLIALVSGWVAGAVLLISEFQLGSYNNEGSENPPVGLFMRGITIAIALLTALSIGSADWTLSYGLPGDTATAGVLLGIIGLLQMSLTSAPHRLSAGILMLLTGFEIIFFRIEPALAVQFLMVIVKIATAVVMSMHANSSSRIFRIRSHQS